MCLNVFAQPVGLTERDLPALSGRRGELAFSVQSPGLLRRHSARLALHGCDVLADDADWDAPTWSMTPEGRTALATAFADLFAQVPGDVVVRALWEGEPAEQFITESRDDFLDRVRRSALGTKATYTVTP